MKRKYVILLLVLTGVFFVIDLPRLIATCPVDPPAGVCDDPNSIGLCAPYTTPCTCSQSGCHSGAVIAASSSTSTLMIVDSAGFINGTASFAPVTTSFKYTPGNTYLMALELNSNTGIYGFELTALNADTSMAGSLVVSDATHTHLSHLGNVQYISHLNASSFLNWAFRWIAPATNQKVTYYYAYNTSTTEYLDSVPPGGGTTGVPGGAIYAGNITVGSITGISDLSDKLANLEIFPNPINNEFNLTFALKQSETISLNVYSSDGRMVKTLMQDEKRGEGSFNSSFDISSLPAGIYLAKLSVGDASITKKITKL